MMTSLCWGYWGGIPKEVYTSPKCISLASHWEGDNFFWGYFFRRGGPMADGCSLITQPELIARFLEYFLARRRCANLTHSLTKISTGLGSDGCRREIGRP